MNKRKSFHVNQVVHVDTDHAEYGRVCSDAIVKDIIVKGEYKNQLFLQVESIRACIFAPRADVTPKVLDYDYYIAEAQKAYERSHMLWRHVNGSILKMLEEGRKQGLTLKEVAKKLRKIAGPNRWDKPVCLSNYRCAARSLAKGEELYLT